MNKFNNALIAGALAAGVAATLGAADADAQERVRWKFHSAWGSNVPHLGTSALRLSEYVARLSGGKFELKFYEPGALIPANDCFDAISKGSIEMCFHTAGYDVGKYPALAFFTAVPFGPQYGEYFAWKIYGGGDELQKRIYAKHNIVTIDCNAIGPETSGWFREKVESLESLRGMKMRFFGLGARVMQKLGVSTQLLAGGDIFPALEKGVIDATEFSMPAMDIKYGFYQIAKHNYFPGWHQQVSVGEVLINKDAWDALPEEYRAMLEIGCAANVHINYAETEAINPDAMNEMRDKYGVITQRWSDEELAAFEKAWLTVLEEDSQNDPLFKEIADSYLAFRKKYKGWGDAQALKPTYQE
ncbi:MAG: TRAP transporter substrate-binding protein [Gammaproteobacteria bacterium]